MLVLLGWAGCCLCASAANISSIEIDRGPGDRGRWGTGFLALIGVTTFGKTNAPFLNPSGPVSVPSGEYYLFLGYENYWTGDVPATIATVTVNYSDGSSRSADFSIGSVTNDVTWSRISGDSLIVLGATGITNLDRIAGVTFGANGVMDIVLKFSDSGPFVDAPVLQSINRTHDAMQFTFSTAVNSSYQVQYATNLTPASWVNLGSPVVATNSLMNATDPIGSDPSRFYRVVIP